MPSPIIVRFLVPLPLYVDGGKTRWRVLASYYGKGHGRLELIAECVSDRAIPAETIASGRSESIEREIRMGMLVKPGTYFEKIAAKLVRERRAEVVPL